MLDCFLGERELKVKVGDRVSVQGHRGIVTEVFHYVKKEWNGREYVPIPGKEGTDVKVHFGSDDELSKWGQYQDGVYGGFVVID